MSMKQNKNAEYLLKVLIVGDSSVGKSCMLLQYTEHTFTDSYISTIGVDFRMKHLRLEGDHVQLQVWDTAGQERFRTITSSYYRGAHGIMIVYDVTRRASFDNVRMWLNEINKNTRDPSAVLKCLIGNKIDSEKRQVSTEDGQRFATELGIPFFEVSAKTSENVNECFTDFATRIFRKRRESLDLQAEKDGGKDVKFEQFGGGKSKCCK